MSTSTLKFYAVTLLSIFILAGCGGGGGSNRGPDGGGTPTTFTVGGTVSGLSGSVVLQMNGAGDLTVNAAGAFTFAAALATGSGYSVAVKAKPANQICTVANATGNIAAANVTNVSVICTTNVPGTFSVSGTVSGLPEVSIFNGLLVLQNNGGDDLPLNANGPFTFVTAIAGGGAYAVEVRTQPESQDCTVANGTGTISANVTNVEVTCRTKVATVGGAVTGLPGGSSVVLQNNGGSDQTINGSNSFTFGSFEFGTAFAITVKAHPSYPAHDCTVADGAGNVGDDAIAIDVSCTALTAAAFTSDFPNVKSVDLVWDAGASAASVASFNIYSSTTGTVCDPSNNNGCTLVGSAGAQSRSFKAAGLTNGTTYNFRLETVFENGARDATGPRSATPNALTFNAPVKAIAVAPDDGTQYLGGDFTEVTIAGSRPQVRKHLAALDATGALLPWRPSVDSTVDNVTVNALAVSGNVVYAGGLFELLNGIFSARRLTAIQRADGSPFTLPGGKLWAVGLPSGVVNALAVRGNTLYVGGQFTNINGVFFPNNLAAVDASTGSVLLDFVSNPSSVSPGSFVSTIVPATIPIGAGATRDVLYVAGQFSRIRGFNGGFGGFVALRNVAQIHPEFGYAIPVEEVEGGDPTPVFQANPRGESNPDTSFVSALAVTGSTVYVGGEFSRIRGESDSPGIATEQVHNLAAVSLNDGVAKRLPETDPSQVSPYFAPNLEHPGVKALAVSGSLVYVGGDFASDGTVPNLLAAFQLTADGAGSPETNLGSTTWANGPDGTVRALSVFGNTVYVGGDFTSLARAPACNHFCTLDVVTSDPIP